MQMLWEHSEQWLFRSPMISIGLLEVPASSDAWRRRCVTPSGIQVAFPSRSLRTVVEGVPESAGDRVITPLDAMVSTPGWVYERSLVDARGERSGVFAFEAGALGESLVRCAHAAGVVRSSDAAFVRQRLLIRRLLSGEALDPLVVEEAAIDVAASVLESEETSADGAGGNGVCAGEDRRSSETALAHAEAVRLANAYIDAHAHTRLSLADVGRAVKMSPAHFARVYRRETGGTIADSVLRIRVRRVLDDVLDTSESLWELSVRHGFGDLAHLSRVFKRAYGVAPSVLRGRGGSAWAKQMRTIRQIRG